MTVVKLICVNCGTMRAGSLVPGTGAGVRRRWQLMAVNVCRGMRCSLCCSQ
jgi:hypothetical protein